MKRGFCMIAAAILTGEACLGNVLDTYTPDALKAEIAAKPKEVLFDFESELTAPKTASTADFVEVRVELDEEKAKVGRGALRLRTDDAADGKIGGSPVLEVQLDPPVDLSKYQALTFWFYVPPDKTDFFFGRYDIRVQLDDTPLMRTWPAVKAGWNWYVFDFGGLESLPEVKSLRVRIGNFLDGYGQADLRFDQFELTPMDKPDLGAASWSARYGALALLAEREGIDALGTVLDACADESIVVRSLAVKLASGLVPENTGKALPALKKILNSPRWRPRLAAMQILSNIQAEPGLGAAAIFDHALLDDNFYVRDLAYRQLRANGESEADIANRLVRLPGQEGPDALPAIRMLSEIGPAARPALPGLLATLRDADRPHLVRCWALRAVWEIDETLLAPTDWALALSLNPGEVHYHLLNRAMDRLEQAASAAVPALGDCLISENPEVRARACVVLGRIGPPAAGAVEALERLLGDVWYVAWEAAQALELIGLGHVVGASPSPQIDFTPPHGVAVGETATTTTLGNGRVELVFRNGDPSPGPFIVRRPGGKNLFEADWLDTILAFKYSKAPNMIERQWLQRLFGSPFSRQVSTGVYRKTPDLVDYMIRFAGDETAPIEFDYHFVVMSGESGFYTYIIARNVSGKDMPGSEKQGAQVGVGRFNFLVALSQDTFDHVINHDKLKGPASFTREAQEPILEGYPDIYQSTYRLPGGDIAAKHEWESYELFSPVTGYAGKGDGVWLIIPSFDFYGDSMPRFIKRPCYGLLFIPHLQGKYYIETGTRITADWQKIYGPMYFYLNEGENTEEMWVDAKREAQRQVGQWPYPWLNDDLYQQRGSVTGWLEVAGGTSPEGAYVILSNPVEAGDPDQHGIWMRNVGPYSYWAQVGSDGSFEITDVHPGNYTLYAFQPGVYGEARPRSVQVTADEVTTMDPIKIDPVSNGTLLWRIGVPDGTAMEFKNGRNYHQWDNYIRYRKDFPNEVNYIVGESDWSKDWNYIHPAIVQGEDRATSWTISFTLESIPDAECLLSIMCSGRSARAQLILNGEKLGDLNVNIGTHHVRTSPIGETVCREYRVDPARLKQGRNRLEISFSKGTGHEDDLHFQQWTSWLCYDFIQMEVNEEATRMQAEGRRAYDEADSGAWRESFSDPCTGDWSEKWFLDGEVGTVRNGPDGMVLEAGPEFGNDAHHMVLWTKASFEGDLKIEYDYTRLDDETRGVNILYIEATGSGEEPYARDISQWSELRRIPAMRMYFDHMEAYHISYAAFPYKEDPRDYIRGRRYLPNGTGLEGSDLVPDYYPVGLFEPGVPHKIAVIKKDRELFMRIENPDQVYFCHMTNTDLPPVTAGRIGLRHMFTRSSCYRDFRISLPE
ncbi:MAG: DUF1961 family protein [Opitutaceae bacterium]